MTEGECFKEMYTRRFEGDAEDRNRLWRTMIDHFFKKYIGSDDTVLDLGAGFCEFINNIKAGKKYAVDLSPHVKENAGEGVNVIVTKSTNLEGIEDAEIDIVFSSNLLEHMSREDIVQTLKEVNRVLKKGGRFLILVPNFKYAYKDFWNFFDHITPLDHHSMREILELNGFRIRELRPKFLPYTTKGKTPKSSFLVKAYLRLGILQKIMGKQMFIVAEKV